MILLPGRRELVTLRDADDYITSLPKAEQNLDEWQAAVEALLLEVELNGPTMFAVCAPRSALVLESANSHACSAQCAIVAASTLGGLRTTSRRR
jgi:hypothetical protein